MGFVSFWLPNISVLDYMHYMAFRYLLSGPTAHALPTLSLLNLLVKNQFPLLLIKLTQAKRYEHK